MQKQKGGNSLTGLLHTCAVAGLVVGVSSSPFHDARDRLEESRLSSETGRFWGLMFSSPFNNNSIPNHPYSWCGDGQGRRAIPTSEFGGGRKACMYMTHKSKKAAVRSPAHRHTPKTSPRAKKKKKRGDTTQESATGDVSMHRSPEWQNTPRTLSARAGSLALKMARKPRAPKREPARKTDGDGMELTTGDGGQSSTTAVESEMLPSRMQMWELLSVAFVLAYGK